MLKKTRIRLDDLQIAFLTEKRCLQQALPESLGEGHSNIFQLDDHLTYIETHYTPKKELAIVSIMDLQEPRLVVTLGLTGHSRFAGKTGDEILFNEGFTSITTFASSIGEREYSADQSVLQLRFSMSRQWLEKHFGTEKCSRWFNRNGLRQLSYQPTSPQGLFAAKQLLTHQAPKEIRGIFMQGQVMTILAAELCILCDDISKSKGQFDQKDQKIAASARDILLQEYKNPPSVEELSLRVGTNQFKLKQLFHYFYDTTPYGLLFDIRMKLAYQILEKRGCPVNIAAELVGYQHASNFSHAFSKHFGISPKIVSKNNRS